MIIKLFTLLIQFITLINYDTESVLHFPDKSHLVVVHYYFHILLDSICYYFTEAHFIWFIRGTDLYFSSSYAILSWF